MSLTKLKDIAFKLAYDHHEAESCQTADADKLALAIRVALEAERERCAKVADQFKPWALKECNVPWEVSEAIRNSQEGRTDASK